MKYDCEVIQDLLPLYEDEVLSLKSIEIINEHITECEKCRKIFQSIKKDKDCLQDIHCEKKVYKRLSRKIRAFRISAAIITAVSVLSVPLICFSADKFNTVNFISSGLGLINVVCTDTEYTEIQSSPKVILAKPDNIKETFTSIIKADGYKCVFDGSNMSSSDDYIIGDMRSMVDDEDTEGVFIIEKDGKKEYVSWSSNSLYSKFVWQ